MIFLTGPLAHGHGGGRRGKHTPRWQTTPWLARAAWSETCPAPASPFTWDWDLLARPPRLHWPGAASAPRPRGQLPRCALRILNTPHSLCSKPRLGPPGTSPASGSADTPRAARRLRGRAAQGSRDDPGAGATTPAPPRRGEALPPGPSLPAAPGPAPAAPREQRLAPRTATCCPGSGSPALPLPDSAEHGHPRSQAGLPPPPRERRRPAPDPLPPAQLRPRQEAAAARSQQACGSRAGSAGPYLPAPRPAAAPGPREKQKPRGSRAGRRPGPAASRRSPCGPARRAAIPARCTHVAEGQLRPAPPTATGVKPAAALLADVFATGEPRCYFSVVKKKKRKGAKTKSWHFPSSASRLKKGWKLLLPSSNVQLGDTAASPSFHFHRPGRRWAQARPRFLYRELRIGFFSKIPGWMQVHLTTFSFLKQLLPCLDFGVLKFEKIYQKGGLVEWIHGFGLLVFSSVILVFLMLFSQAFSTAG